MTSARLIHIVPASVIFLLSCLVAYLSFNEEPAEAYLFPRVVSIVFIGLAIWNLARALMGLSRVGGGISKQEMRNIAPGLVVILGYVFFAASGLGFYVSSTLVFLLIYTLYDPAPLNSGRDWIKRIAITAVFMAIIYVLFALVLQVQTPRGHFF